MNIDIYIFICHILINCSLILLVTIIESRNIKHCYPDTPMSKEPNLLEQFPKLSFIEPDKLAEEWQERGIFAIPHESKTSTG